MEPAFIFGEQEWSFGKHYFQVDVAFQIDPLLDGSNMSSKRKQMTGYVTVGLLCKLRKKKSENDDQGGHVMVGCKVNVKDKATVQVYVNLEKHVLICIANNVTKERFDIQAYSTCLPMIKYDGDAHMSAKVLTTAQFDQ